MWKVQLSKLNFDDREADAAFSVVKSGWLSMGTVVSRFESAFNNFLGHGVHSIAVSNCTAALHMSLLSIGLEPEDEVIIPGLTFVADINSVILAGGKPVLSDSTSLDDWNVSARTIEKSITPKTKAVIVVHFAGFPCDMPSIKNLCLSKGLFLIEDVAHAPGASIAGKKCGTWGDVSCFSFFSNKNLSTGEGGMVASSNPEIIEHLKNLRSHGMTSLTFDRHNGRSISYDVLRPGLNYRMDEIRAAIGLVQLDKLEAGNLRRQNLFKRYKANFSESDISIPFQGLSYKNISAFHILPILLPRGCDRMHVIEFLKENGIQSSIHYPPFWQFSAFKQQFSVADYPNVNEITNRELTLPLFPTMSFKEVDLVADTLLKAIK
ncbi:DegT/DnrJ/EryC1/StrS aminotransferase family protein [Opitutales bacterium]|nr:DegT/DnrJ/EryC1/StrS aminotransferase family protein [Opitutales bacterium]